MPSVLRTVLPQHEVVSYLMAAGLLRSRDAVRGELVVRDVSRRNNNFQLLSESGTSYLIKQGVGAERRATIASEAALYQFFCSSPMAAGLSRHLPVLVHYDHNQAILVLEMRPGARTVREHYLRVGRFSRSVAASLGEALAALHALGRNRPDPSVPAGRPWVMTFHHCELQSFGEYSDACLSLIRIIQQQPGFAELLDGVRARWRPECLVHNDVRWDNCIVAPHRRSPGRTEFSLVDWELAAIGDPAWDVGSVFAGYLSLWLLSIPPTTETDPSRLPHLARWPLERMHPAVGDCWDRYVRGRGLDDASAGQHLLRSVEMAAARLLQIAVEQSQDSREPTAEAILALQLAENMLRRPGEAAQTLLGVRRREVARAS